MEDLQPISRRVDARDDHFSWGDGDSLAAGVALAFVVGLLVSLLVGCSSGGASDVSLSLGERVHAEVMAAWDEHDDLPMVRDRGDCGRLWMLGVVAPATIAGYIGWCPEKSWACLRWIPLPGHVRSLHYPVAVMSPYLSADRWPSHAVHEHVHAVALCSLGHYDYDHADPRLWQPHPDSVEALAVEAIYHPPSPAAE